MEGRGNSEGGVSQEAEKTLGKGGYGKNEKGELERREMERTTGVLSKIPPLGKQREKKKNPD